MEGGVDLVHDGLVERADPPMILLDGDIVRTGNGRAEIVFADGTLLHLDHSTELELLSPERLRLLSGRVLIRVSPAAVARYIVDTPAASVRLDARGEYGLTTDDQRAHLDLTVARGVAEISDAGQRIVVRGGERLSITGPGARGLIEPFNSARWDSFDRWSSDRSNGFTAAASSRQLPYELRAYGPVLDQYGRWDYVAPHGYVWFPAVSASWRPYYDGSWAHTRYGWTWYGRDRWAWPTHHYGRWGFNGNFWFWIPARAWAGAWVSWAFAPGFVSWCPLGWDNRPVAGIWGRPGDHPAYWPNYSPWRAWTVMPRDHFGGRRAVRNFAIDGDRLDEPTRRAIIVQNTAPPAPVGNAVPRGSLSAPSRLPSLPGSLTSINPGAIPRSATDDVRRGNVRRPGADDSRVIANPRATTPSRAYTPAPTRRADDPPAVQPRGTSRDDGGDRDGASRRTPRATSPAYTPPSTYTAPPQQRPSTRDDAPADRGARPRGTVRDPGGSSPRSQPASPPPQAQRPASRGDSGGAVRRGDTGASRPAPRQPSASEGSRGSGGAVRRRPG